MARTKHDKEVARVHRLSRAVLQVRNTAAFEFPSGTDRARPLRDKAFLEQVRRICEEGLAEEKG